MVFLCICWEDTSIDKDEKILLIIPVAVQYQPDEGEPDGGAPEDNDERTDEDARDDGSGQVIVTTVTHTT